MEIEAGNGHLAELMGHLTRESAQFETLMTGARTVISELGGKFAALPGTASLLEESKHRLNTLSPADACDGEQLFGELYRHYTMQTERDVHLAHCDRFGIARPPSIIAHDAGRADAEDVLFF